MEESKRQYKKVDVQLLNEIVNVIATSKNELTFIQQQELFKLVMESEDIIDEEIKDDNKSK